GYEFDGWYENSGYTDPWDFVNDTIPVNGITLFAKWKPNKYTVNFDSKGGDYYPLPVTGEIDSTIARPQQPNLEGHTFRGWFKDESYTRSWVFDVDTIPLNGITLYARWVPNTYTVRFDIQADLVDPPAQSVLYGGTVPKPSPDPVLANYMFMGWYKD